MKSVNVVVSNTNFQTDLGVFISAVIKIIVIDSEGLGFDLLVGQIEHSADNDSLTLRCFFGAALSIR